MGMIDPVVARYDVSESLKKQLAVAVVEKDRLAGITPTSQMINRSGKFQAKRPCHGELVLGYLFDLGLKGNQYTGMMESILEERRFPKVPIAMRIGNYEGIKQAVCAGIGVAILPQFTVQNEIRNQALVRIHIKGVNLDAKIMLVERTQALQRPTTASAKSFLSTAISKS